LCRYLVAEKAFSSIVVFEQRLNVGGVWNATPDITDDKTFTIPQTQPIQSEAGPVWKSEAKGSAEKLQFLSPIYDNLETNIPRTLMNYSDLPFPKDTALFPHFSVVLRYLERYADDVRHLIRFGTQVLEVHPIIKTGKWSVTTHDLKMKDSVSEMTVFDAVIVANGHYNDPFVPAIKGIEEWNTAYPGSISHSKYYRRPDEFKNKVKTDLSHLPLASSLCLTDI
jgi:cation diffusion facilitator CzcD-associated flavoprotein CzcO